MVLTSVPGTGTLYPDVVDPVGAAHREHQEPPQRRRPARRPEVSTRRTAAAAVQRRGARKGRPRAGPARGNRVRQPFPGPGLGIRIVARSPRSGWRRCGMPIRSRARSSPRRAWTTRSGSVGGAVADIRSVGVQGDGRTYGTRSCCGRVSEDAMTPTGPGAPSSAGADLHPHHNESPRSTGGAGRHKQAAGHHPSGIAGRGQRSFSDESLPTEAITAVIADGQHQPDRASSR